MWNLQFMVCGIIWADRITPRGEEATMGYRELDIVTTKMTCKGSINRDKQEKLIQLNGSHVTKSKKSKQQS